MPFASTPSFFTSFFLTRTFSSAPQLRRSAKSTNGHGFIRMAAMADKRLLNVLLHLSPPVMESPPTAGLSELGHGGGVHLLECDGPNSDREVKLLENLMLSRLRRFENCDTELRLVPCRGEPKSQEEHEGIENWENVEAPIRSEELGDGERAELVRSGITSASAVSSSAGGQVKVKVEKKSKSMRVAACEFCDIIQGAAPCFKLYEDELCLCILDINPLSVGHSLVLPKSHFPCLEATPPQVAAAMCAAVPLISRALLAATRCDSFNMLVNSGVAAGQVIMHTHFHIIPRCKDDGLWKSESATRKPMRKVQEAKLLAQAVRTTLSSTVGR